VILYKIKEIKELRGGVQTVHRTSDSADLSASGGLTQRLWKRAISGWKVPMYPVCTGGLDRSWEG